MILNVSGRTDIVAFYTKWFMNRYKEGYVDVRNPFNHKLVSRIDFSDVDLIVFCTKNPIPIVKYLKDIKIPILFHITITGYNNDIEVNVKNKDKIIDAVKEISNIIGKDNVYVRYDPIFVSDKYSINYHIKAFNKLCGKISGYVENIIISFMDEYKNVRKNKDILNARKLEENDYKEIGTNFYNIANKYGIEIFTCFEKNDMTKYGFIKRSCVNANLAYRLTGKAYPKWKSRDCGCVEMVDIGEYNTCNHRCKYCYANYDESKINKNILKHNNKSSLLIGNLEYDDIIKLRK